MNICPYCGRPIDNEKICPYCKAEIPHKESKKEEKQ